MTRTFNPESYGKLLAQYQPKTITTEEENEKAIALVQDLEHRANRIPEEEILLELLVTLIEKFEETHYPIPQGTPHSMLVHLMDARDISPEVLAETVGSLEVVQEILNGDRTINQAEAEALAEYFHVSANLFLTTKG
ncbi:type II toxin-antitoxin system HigA family antitoxin [Nostoc sp. PCC 7107]|uniref:helix-turn-helix domain-containing protein n=1 Tax=Nostoc sp. PCC 7107 TaxID=317936 RepID=UPI00029F4597|nr:helix-turn-helix domain-containing protein [Nostoc sp. PCC 7107]AFY41845.1 helix-turn-helix domain protein [Nostoc sp. PCC 7107]